MTLALEILEHALTCCTRHSNLAQKSKNMIWMVAGAQGHQAGQHSDGPERSGQDCRLWHQRLCGQHPGCGESHPCLSDTICLLQTLKPPLSLINLAWRLGVALLSNHSRQGKLQLALPHPFKRAVVRGNIRRRA
jgi:hypothetical protein